MQRIQCTKPPTSAPEGYVGSGEFLALDDADLGRVLGKLCTWIRIPWRSLPLATDSAPFLYKLPTRVGHYRTSPNPHLSNPNIRPEEGYLLPTYHTPSVEFPQLPSLSPTSILHERISLASSHTHPSHASMRSNSKAAARIF